MDLDLAALADLTEEELGQLDTEHLLALIEASKELVERWQPTERQARALAFAVDCDEIFYGGAVGGGKTVLALQHAYQLSLRHPGHRSIILRRTFPEVRKSLIPPSLRMFDQRKAKFLVGEYVWRFENGSTIEFGHMEGPYDWVRYMGSEYDLAVWDELTHFEEEMYTEVNTRVRTTKKRVKEGVRPHVLATSNPGGIGHTWVKERFIDPAPPETPFVHRNHRIVYVPARLTDNPYIDDAYSTQLDQLSPTRRRALADGDWDANELQFFTQWDPNIHVIEPFDVPEWWPRERGLDYGYNDPLAVVWGAWNDGIVYIYKEVYERELVPSQQVEVIKAVNDDDKILLTYADTQIWNRTGVGEPVSTQYARLGLVCVPAMKARVSGWAAVRDRMLVRLDAEGIPRTKIYVFNTCRNLIKEIGALPRNPRNGEDADTNAPDHACDALRYMVMTHGRRGSAPDEEMSPITKMQRHSDRQRRQHKRTHPLLGSGY